MLVLFANPESPYEGVAQLIEAVSAAPWFVAIVLLLFVLPLLLAAAALVAGWWDMRAQRKEHTAALNGMVNGIGNQTQAINNQTTVISQGNQATSSAFNAINSRLDSTDRRLDGLGAHLGTMREDQKLLLDRTLRSPDRAVARREEDLT